MKKLLSLALACVLILSVFPMLVSAEGELPFTLKAPGNVAAAWLEGHDSPTTMRFVYNLDNEIAAFFQTYEEARNNGEEEALLADYDFDEIWINVQIDWAIDDVNDEISGWHYNQYWDAGVNGVKYDEDWNIRTSEWDVVDWGLNNATETVQDVWILRGVPEDDRWLGAPDTKTPGVKDQLRPEQYEYYDDDVHIDFTEHTAYFRARFYVTTRKDTEEGIVDRYYFSDWSETCAAGKDAKSGGTLHTGDIAAPVITGLRMTDEEFNGNPVVAYTLTVPDELRNQAAFVTVAGGYIVIETYARVKGETEWAEVTGDNDLRPGEMKAFLIYLAKEGETIPKDTVIELRSRYRCGQPELDDIYSDWSKIISFGTDDISLEPGSTSSGEADPDENAPAEKGKCSICHFCPQPLGLCIFIWLAILLVVIAVIVIVLKAKKKNKK